MFFPPPGIRRRLTMTIMLTLLPVVLPGLMLAGYLIHQEVSQEIGLRQEAVLSAVSTDLTYLARQAASDLLFISRLPAVNNFMNGLIQGRDRPTSPASLEFWRKSTENIFKNLMAPKAIYDQVRLLDLKGREVLRVNQGEGGLEPALSEQLQSKADRYYFQAILKLHPGQVYVSPIDLNVERGVVERPAKGMIRFGALLTDPEEKPAGVIIVNYLTDKMFAGSFSLAHRQEGSVWFVVDQAGFYLYHPSSPDRAWGGPGALDTGHSLRRDFPGQAEDILAGQAARVEWQGRDYNVYTRRVDLWPESDKFVILVGMVPGIGLGLLLKYFVVLLAIAGVFSGLAGLVAWRSGRAVTASVLALSGAVTRFRQGDWDSRSAVESRDEIGQLSAAFNDMADQLQGHYRHLESEVHQAVAQIEATTATLRESEARLKAIIDNTVEAIVTIDEGGLILSLNKAGERIFGYRAEEVIGRNVTMLMPPFCRERHDRYLADYLRTGQAKIIGTSREAEAVRRDGTVFPLFLAVSEVRLGEKRIFTGILRDITEQKRAEGELQESRERLQQITEALEDVSWLLDLGTLTVLFVSPAYEKLWGRQREEIYRNTNAWMEAILPEDRPRVEEAFGRVAETNKYDEMYRIARPDGTIRWIRDRGYAIRDKDGRPYRMAGVAQDVTALKQAETDLIRARDLAERANRAKSDFLATMSHELRTPLNAVIGFSEILADQAFGPLNDKQARYVQHILGSGRHLLSLINDILDLSKVEAGKMELDLTEVNLAPLLERSLVMIKEKALKHGITLELSIAEELQGQPFRADERKLKQIVFNLISNAAKFTPDGGRISLKAEVSAGQLLISVADTGIGISPQDQERIFEEFVQGDSSYARKQQGTGLGLSLTRRLAELHGGRIWLHSGGQGQGSVFYVQLPLRPGSGEAPPPPPAPPAEVSQTEAASEPVSSASRRPVLVVDDDEGARQLLAQYLAEGGYRAVLAKDGDEALALAREVKPLAITLDLLMTNKTGFDVLYELKTSPETAGIPVVIVSVLDDKAHGLELGAADYLQKPVDKNTLLEALSRVGPCLGGALRNILVIDDEPEVIELIASLLEPKGCRILKALGGQEGLDLALRHKPDLIILDLIMPGLSGWEVVKEMRKRSEGGHVPIIIFTAKRLTVAERKELAGAVQAVVLKGGGKEELLAEVARLARLVG